MAQHLVFILALALSLSLSSSAWAFPDKYDRDIKKAAHLYLPGVFSWKIYKAQLYQESLLNPTAESHVGASGIAQFMPATWKEVKGQLGFAHSASAKNPKLAIKAGAYYMAKLRRFWKAKRPEFHRHSLAMASYNAGTGNILKAQRICGDARMYNEIVVCLPKVTGRHSEETITYVNRIWRYWRRMMVER